MLIGRKEGSAGDVIGDDASRVAPLQELQSRLSDRLGFLKSASAIRRAFVAMEQRIEELEKDKLQLQAELRALALREACRYMTPGMTR